MDFDYDTVVAFSKSWGLFYMMAFFLCVCVYAFWVRKVEYFIICADVISINRNIQYRIAIHRIIAIN